MRRNVIGNVFKISASATAMLPTKIPAEMPNAHRSSGPNGIRICKNRRQIAADSSQNPALSKCSVSRTVAFSNHAGITPMTIRNANVPAETASPAASPQKPKYMLN